jgi:hypothetical protein
MSAHVFVLADDSITDSCEICRQMIVHVYDSIMIDSVECV